MQNLKFRTFHELQVSNYLSRVTTQYPNSFLVVTWHLNISTRFKESICEISGENSIHSRQTVCGWKKENGLHLCSSP